MTNEDVCEEPGGWSRSTLELAALEEELREGTITDPEAAERLCAGGEERPWIAACRDAVSCPAMLDALLEACRTGSSAFWTPEGDDEAVGTKPLGKRALTAIHADSRQAADRACAIVFLSDYVRTYGDCIPTYRSSASPERPALEDLASRLLNAARLWQGVEPSEAPSPDEVLEKAGTLGWDHPLRLARGVLQALLELRPSWVYVAPLLELLAHLAGEPLPELRRVTVPALLHIRGRAGTLAELDLMETRAGIPGIAPDPIRMAFFWPGNGFREAVDEAWNWVTGQVSGEHAVRYRVRWSLDLEPRLEGPSLGAAFAVALRILLVPGRYPPIERWALTGGIRSEGTLTSVGGEAPDIYRAKLKAAAGARPPLNVIVPKDDWRVARTCASTLRPRIEVRAASDVHEALELIEDLNRDQRAALLVLAALGAAFAAPATVYLQHQAQWLGAVTTAVGVATGVALLWVLGVFLGPALLASVGAKRASATQVVDRRATRPEALLPNLLTASRPALGVSAALLLPLGEPELAFWIYLACQVTDVFDGILAAVLVQGTPFGKRFDAETDAMSNTVVGMGVIAAIVAEDLNPVRALPVVALVIIFLLPRMLARIHSAPERLSIRGGSSNAKRLSGLVRITLIVSILALLPEASRLPAIWAAVGFVVIGGLVEWRRMKTEEAEGTRSPGGGVVHPPKWLSG